MPKIHLLLLMLYSIHFLNTAEQSFVHQSTNCNNNLTTIQAHNHEDLYNAINNLPIELEQEIYKHYLDVLPYSSALNSYYLLGKCINHGSRDDQTQGCLKMGFTQDITSFDPPWGNITVSKFTTNPIHAVYINYTKDSSEYLNVFKPADSSTVIKDIFFLPCSKDTIAILADCKTTPTLILYNYETSKKDIITNFNPSLLQEAAASGNIITSIRPIKYKPMQNNILLAAWAHSWLYANEKSVLQDGQKILQAFKQLPEDDRYHLILKTQTPQYGNLFKQVNDRVKLLEKEPKFQEIFNNA